MLRSHATPVYLDNAATTPLCEEAARAMRPYMEAGDEAWFGNANSLHGVGRNAFVRLEDARLSVARSLKASRPDEVVFTSGATEADNAALVGMALAARDAARQRGRRVNGGHVVVSRIEHDAVLGSARMLKALGFEVSFADNDSQGRVSAGALERAMREDTLLVSIMAANNEVGTIEPVAELAQAAHERGALFHSDAVQLFGKEECFSCVLEHADAASFSAHKIGGPKGVGVLYLKTRTPFQPYLAGGGQERGLRSGTQNVAGIAGAAAAFEHYARFVEERADRMREVRDYLYEKLSECSKAVPSVAVPRGSRDFLPNIVSVCVRGWESETLIMQLDARGFCVSGGSACSSASLDPSHVLTALGIERNLAQGSVRISLGEDASIEQADAFLAAFFEVVGV